MPTKATITACITLLWCLLLSELPECTSREFRCADTHDSCVQWAARGECYGNPDYMLARCCASCKRLSFEADTSNHVNTLTVAMYLWILVHVNVYTPTGAVYMYVWCMCACFVFVFLLAFVRRVFVNVMGCVWNHYIYIVYIRPHTIHTSCALYTS